MHAPAVRLDIFGWGATAHPNDDGPREDRVGQVAEACERDGTIGWDFFCLDELATGDTATSNGAAPVTGIEQTADLLVVLGFRPEDGVDLVEQDRRPAFLGSDLAEQIRRR